MVHDLNGIFMRRASVLLTGAGGYLGQVLARELAQRGHGVCRVGRRPGDRIDRAADLLDKAQVEELLGRENASVVIHAAANVPHSSSGLDERAAAQQSVLMTRRLAEALASGHRQTPMIYVSSMTVYSGGSARPFHEAVVLGQSDSPYAEGKREAELVISRSGLAGFATRIPGLYGGERQTGLMANLRAALHHGRPIRLPEAPLLWAAMHVEHAANYIADLVGLRPAGFEPVNIGYSGPSSIDILMQIAGRLSGRALASPVVHPVFEFDLGRFTELTGREPPTFQQAVEDYLR